MPRAKKNVQVSPPKVPPLQDCKIAFVRLTAVGVDGVSKADLESQIPQKGGLIVSKIGECTHFIASSDQYQKSVARVKEAIARDDVHIVTFDWLKQSLNSDDKIDEHQYTLHSRSEIDQEGAGDKPAANGKRSRDPSDDEDDSSTSKKKAKVPKKSTTKKEDAKPPAVTINVPVDDELPNKANYKVVNGDDGTIYDVTLNQTNSGYNNNKFYRIQLLIDGKEKHWCWTRWGRVGERGQSKMLGGGAFDQAFKEFNKKFRDKNGNPWEKRLEPVRPGKYSFIERSYEDSDEEDEPPTKAIAGKKTGVKEEAPEEADEPMESKLAEPVQRLMKLIFNQEYFTSTLADLEYDANKMPLGKLSKNTLLRGYAVLKDLTNLIGISAGPNVAEMSDQYFSLIPHAFGRNRPPVLHTLPMIKKEIELLESLTDMQLANDIMKNAKSKKEVDEKMNILDRQYAGLGMQEMTPLDPKSKEFTGLQDYLVKSQGHTHHLTYKVQDIFRIERQGEDARFESSKYANMPNTDRRLLWHGSRSTNFGGILSQGLRIAPPEAPVSGYMFGKGVYLADMSSKSANYCCSYISGGVGLLLLCEAELGTPPLKLTQSDYDAGNNAAKQGSISTLGMGQSAPQGWKDAGCIHKNLKGVMMPDVVTQPPGPTNEPNAYLQYNEYIVYDVAQVKLRYLLRCQID